MITDKVKSVAFSCGYAEQAKLGLCVFTVDSLKFDYPDAAFNNLSLYLLNCFLEDWNETVTMNTRVRGNHCSSDHTTVKTNYCPNCGMKMYGRKPDEYEFREWIYQLPDAELHTWDYDDNYESWLPYWDTDNTLHVLAKENGEVEISKRIKKLKPDALEWEEDD